MASYWHCNLLSIRTVKRTQLHVESTLFYVSELILKRLALSNWWVVAGGPIAVRQSRLLSDVQASLCVIKAGRGWVTVYADYLQTSSILHVCHGIIYPIAVWLYGVKTSTCIEADEYFREYMYVSWYECMTLMTLYHTFLTRLVEDFFLMGAATIGWAVSRPAHSNSARGIEQGTCTKLTFVPDYLMEPIVHICMHTPLRVPFFLYMMHPVLDPHHSVQTWLKTSFMQAGEGRGERRGEGANPYYPVLSCRDMLSNWYWKTINTGCIQCRSRL